MTGGYFLCQVEMKLCLDYVYSLESQAIQGPAGPGPEKPLSPCQDWAYPLQ